MANKKAEAPAKKATDKKPAATTDTKKASVVKPANSEVKKPGPDNTKAEKSTIEKSTAAKAAGKASAENNDVPQGERVTPEESAEGKTPEIKTAEVHGTPTHPDGNLKPAAHAVGRHTDPEPKLDRLEEEMEEIKQDDPDRPVGELPEPTKENPQALPRGSKLTPEESAAGLSPERKTFLEEGNPVARGIAPVVVVTEPLKRAEKPQDARNNAQIRHAYRG